MAKKTRQARMISAVVQKLSVVQTFRRLVLRLLVGLDRRCCRRALLQNVTNNCENDGADQRELDFFRSLRSHLLFPDRLPAFNFPDLQIHEQRKKEDEDQRDRQPFASEA